MDASAPTVTLAIVTRDRPELFARHALPSLLGLPDAGVEVIVVDQSGDGRTRALAERVPGMRYLRTRPGLSHGRNAAAAAASGEVLAFTDDDVDLPEGWIAGIRRAFAAEPDLGCVCGPGVDGDGNPLPGRRPGRYVWPANPFGLAHGFNMALRLDAMRAVGGFDPRLGAGAEFRAAEDSDMLYRIMRAGWPVRCDGSLVVVHHVWRSVRERTALHGCYGFGAGAQTAKHLRRGDLTALRLALAEAGGHCATLARWLLKRRPRLALLQVVWAAGALRGFSRALARRL
jgi:GT2 family glycosyltransferase